MLLESASLPIPSEVVLPLAGYLVYTGRFDFFAALAWATGGSLVGSLVDYLVGYYLGREWLVKRRAFRLLGERRLQEAEVWFGRHGAWAVFLARFAPLVRTLIAFPAGFAKMRVHSFAAYSFAGMLGWDVILIYAGMVFGSHLSAFTSSLYSAFTVFEALAAIAIVVVLVYLFGRGGSLGGRKSGL
ncbi:MAG: DedA family protein [Thermoprotei archaeon]